MIPASVLGGSRSASATSPPSAIVPAPTKITPWYPSRNASGPPSSVAASSENAITASERPMIRSNSRVRRRCRSVSNSSAGPDPENSVIAIAISRYATASTPKLSASAKTIDAIVKPNPPSASDTRRPNRSATAPVGTSATITAIQNTTSISAT